MRNPDFYEPLLLNHKSFQNSFVYVASIWINVTDSLYIPLEPTMAVSRMPEPTTI